MLNKERLASRLEYNHPAETAEQAFDSLNVMIGIHAGLYCQDFFCPVRTDR